mmetsp:Transcript_64553/g.135489  ORF Transcript_64553/g.135489 Transcript_64553/m.135489 type:complete len:202 (+) Transcript_64553:1126-1731(+)
MERQCRLSVFPQQLSNFREASGSDEPTGGLLGLLLPVLLEVSAHPRRFGGRGCRVALEANLDTSAMPLSTVIDDRLHLPAYLLAVIRFLASPLPLSLPFLRPLSTMIAPFLPSFSLCQSHFRPRAAVRNRFLPSTVYCPRSCVWGDLAGGRHRWGSLNETLDRTSTEDFGADGQPWFVGDFNWTEAPMMMTCFPCRGATTN